MKRLQIKAKMLETTQIGLALASTLLLSSTVNPSMLLKAEAQPTDQDSLLPPEVVPSSQFSASSTSSTPGLISSQDQANQPAGQIQSAQDFRKALMDSLAGKGNYPQFDGRNPYGNQFGQNNNQFAPTGQPMGNQSFANQGQPPLGQSNWTAPTQDNTMANAVPPQTQTLSGPVPVSQTPYRGGNTYAHGLGNVTSLGATIYSGAMTGGSGLYGLGYTGASLLNYGYQNGMKGF